MVDTLAVACRDNAHGRIRRRHRFWTVVRALLRISMWLWFATAVLNLVAQADQLGGAAAAAGIALVFAAALALATHAQFAAYPT